MHHAVDDFRLGERAMRYSLFAPRLYNYCLSLGFRRGLTMPSRAFCSDETQGYPIMLLTQHFGTFPFDHGRVGGKVATDRHGPHAHHGEDLVIVQASHVGYDAVGRRFGLYPRPRTETRGFGANCGKICGVLKWYQEEYDFARRHIFFREIDGEKAVVVDNALLNDDRAEGLILRKELLFNEPANAPLRILSTAKAFVAAPRWREALPEEAWTNAGLAIGDRLTADLFAFRRLSVEGPEGHDLLEDALKPAMPSLVTSAQPALDAARYFTQVEFDRTYRSIGRSGDYRGRNLLFLAGLNIDVAPVEDLPFPLTKFVPWAGYWQARDGAARVIEQDELCDALSSQPVENPDQVSFDAAIAAMARAEPVKLPI